MGFTFEEGLITVDDCQEREREREGGIFQLSNVVVKSGEIFEVSFVNTNLIDVLLLNYGNIYEQHSSCQYKQELRSPIVIFSL